MRPAAFYCATGAAFFPGAVALVNSLRLLGHDEPIFILDCGLEPGQRRLLETEAELLEAPADEPPSMLKLVAPLAEPAAAMAVLDADVIVTRPLGELLARAGGGDLVGFENESPRFDERWGPLLGLGELEPGPYLNSSALFAGGDGALELLAEARARLSEIDRTGTWLGRGDPTDPFLYADQDVVNAVALARLPRERIVALGSELAAIPPFDGVRIDDAETLAVSGPGGGRPFMLHHYARKPWLVRLRSNPYSRLMTRLTLAPDVAIGLDPSDLPARLRPGAAGAVARAAVDLFVGAPRSLGRRVAGGRREVLTAWPEADR